MYEQRVRLSPRVSLTKLAEYITASPARRRSIIVEQREPKDCVLPLYTEASISISRFLVTGDPRELAEVVRRLEDETVDSKWDIDRRENQIRAIKLGEALAKQLELSGVTCTTGANNVPKLKIEGVDVSVRPEVFLSWRDRKGRDRAGAIKLYFSKGHPLDDEAGKFAATVLRRYVEDNVKGVVDGRRCLVLDVFAGRIFVAPDTWKRRMKDVFAACLEILVGWKY